MSYAYTCKVCHVSYEAKVPHQNYCSSSCRKTSALKRNKGKVQALTLEEWTSRKRDCGHCGQQFQLENKHANNKRYCSGRCQRAGYARNINEFHKRNPGKMTEYNQTRVAKHGREVLMTRLRRRYADLPVSCESCGESRVLDVAHKPEYARKGAHRTMVWYERHMFWILCPTCHAIVDRGICSSSDLKLK